MGRQGRHHQHADGPLPTPTRYQVVRLGETGDFGLAPAIGVAYRPIPQLSFGATLQVAMLSATSFVVQNATSGVQPATDWLVEAQAEDFFVPRSSSPRTRNRCPSST